MSTTTPPLIRRLGLVVAGAALAWHVDSAAACQVESGPTRAALIELYTSEGCSSCPPADQQLRQLPRSLDARADVVPLSLHVDYWDSIGWKDPFAQRRFNDRQSLLVDLNHQRTVYTPQFFVGGRELRSWRGGLQESVRQVNGTPAAADIRIEARPTASGSLAVTASARSAAAPAALYVALTENGLSSRVTRGENGGSTLAHDHVVRAFYGPIALTSGQVTFARDIPLPADWNRQHLEVATFVANDRTGEVLQALAARECAVR